MVKINYNNIKYKKPNFNIEYCIKNNKTYNVKLWIPITISYKRKFICLYDYFKSNTVISFNLIL